MNCRGTSGLSPNERFHFDAWLSSDVTYLDGEALGTAGSTATGFSANNSTNVSWIRCTARNMSVAHGFYNASRNLLYGGCRSYPNAGIGFNSDVSQDVLYDHCLAGGSSATTTGAYPFGSNQAREQGEWLRRQRHHRVRGRQLHLGAHGGNGFSSRGTTSGKIRG